MRQLLQAEDQETLASEGASHRRWVIPSFLVRDYQFGYERECYEYFFGGDSRRGARDVADGLSSQIEVEIILDPTEA